MSKLQNLLIALLVIQLLCTGGLYAYHTRLESSQAQGVQILSFAKENIDKLSISDNDHKISLLNKDGNWVIDDTKLPADKEKVEGLLDTLRNLKGSWPVATTEDSYQQLKVADKGFEHKLELFDGPKLEAELYLGTSPSFRKTHVRSAKGSEVYAVELSAMDTPTQSDAWLDHGLLAIKEPSSISGRGFSIEKKDKDWKLKEAGVLNQSHAQSLTKALEDLKITGLAADEVSGPATLSYQVKSKAGTVSLEVWLKGKDAVIKRSDINQAFKLAKPAYDNLASFSLAKLTEKEASATSKSTSPKSKTSANKS